MSANILTILGGAKPKPAPAAKKPAAKPAPAPKPVAAAKPAPKPAPALKKASVPAVKPPAAPTAKKPASAPAPAKDDKPSNSTAAAAPAAASAAAAATPNAIEAKLAGDNKAEADVKAAAAAAATGTAPNTNVNKSATAMVHISAEAFSVDQTPADVKAAAAAAAVAAAPATPPKLSHVCCKRVSVGEPLEGFLFIYKDKASAEADAKMLGNNGLRSPDGDLIPVKSYGTQGHYSIELSNIYIEALSKRVLIFSDINFLLPDHTESLKVGSDQKQRNYYNTWQDAEICSNGLAAIGVHEVYDYVSHNAKDIITTSDGKQYYFDLDEQELGQVKAQGIPFTAAQALVSAAAPFTPGYRAAGSAAADAKASAAAVAEVTAALSKLKYVKPHTRTIGLQMFYLASKSDADALVTVLSKAPFNIYGTDNGLRSITSYRGDYCFGLNQDEISRIIANGVPAKLLDPLSGLKPGAGQ